VPRVGLLCDVFEFLAITESLVLGADRRVGLPTYRVDYVLQSADEGVHCGEHTGFSDAGAILGKRNLPCVCVLFGASFTDEALGTPRTEHRRSRKLSEQRRRRFREGEAPPSVHPAG
jgi:hypothetical protein